VTSEPARAEDRFLRVAAHELRTPLASIRGYAEEVLEDVGSPLAATQREAVETILRNAARMGTLLDDMLLALRLDTGHAELEPVALDLLDLAREAAAEAGDRGAEITIGGSAATVEGDARLLRRAVRALIRSGLAGNLPGATLDLRVACQDESVHLLVRNAGPPPSEHGWQRALQCFDCAETSGDRAGTGLELAIARSVAEAHGGRLELRRREGPGTTVAMVLPRR
jgi:signal transduction histidine kinase